MDKRNPALVGGAPDRGGGLGPPQEPASFEALTEALSRATFDATTEYMEFNDGAAMRPPAPPLPPPLGQAPAAITARGGLPPPEPEAPSPQAAIGGAPLSEGAALDEAVSKTLASMGEEGKGRYSPEELEAARARARRLAAEMKEDPGYSDLRNLNLSLGLPAVRLVFRQMLRAAGVRGADKRAILKEIEAFSPVTEKGCMSIGFTSQKTRRPDQAFVLLDECQRGHDFSAQLDPLKEAVVADKWNEVLRTAAAVVHIGRATYAKIAQENLSLIRRIFRRTADDPCTEYLELKVDMKNTTLYLDPSWPHRIGVFVHFESAMSSGLAKAMGADKGAGGR